MEHQKTTEKHEVEVTLTLTQNDNAANARVVSFKLQTDDLGWPYFTFSSADQDFRLVGEFLQDDVGLLKPVCAEVSQGLQAVLTDQEEEWTWCGNRFFVRVRKDTTEITDMHGENGLNTEPLLVDTLPLSVLACLWMWFVAEIPRQREFDGLTQTEGNTSNG